MAPFLGDFNEDRDLFSIRTVAKLLERVLCPFLKWRWVAATALERNAPGRCDFVAAFVRPPILSVVRLGTD